VRKTVAFVGTFLFVAVSIWSVNVLETVAHENAHRVVAEFLGQETEITYGSGFLSGMLRHWDKDSPVVMTITTIYANGEVVTEEFRTSSLSPKENMFIGLAPTVFIALPAFLFLLLLLHRGRNLLLIVPVGVLFVYGAYAVDDMLFAKHGDYYHLAALSGMSFVGPLIAVLGGGCIILCMILTARSCTNAFLLFAGIQTRKDKIRWRYLFIERYIPKSSP